MPQCRDGGVKEEAQGEGGVQWEGTEPGDAAASGAGEVGRASADASGTPGPADEQPGTDDEDGAASTSGRDSKTTRVLQTRRSRTPLGARPASSGAGMEDA